MFKRLLLAIFSVRVKQAIANMLCRLRILYREYFGACQVSLLLKSLSS
jgi:hypothetical protein